MRGWSGVWRVYVCSDGAYGERGCTGDRVPRLVDSSVNIKRSSSSIRYSKAGTIDAAAAYLTHVGLLVRRFVSFYDADADAGGGWYAGVAWLLCFCLLL